MLTPVGGSTPQMWVVALRHFQLSLCTVLPAGTKTTDLMSRRAIRKERAAVTREYVTILLSSLIDRHTLDRNMEELERKPEHKVIWYHTQT